MKQTTVLKLLENLEPEMLGPEPTWLAQAGPNPPPTSEQDRTHLALLILPAQSDLAGYPHWGLNE